MKNHINLLYKKSHYKRTERFFALFRKITFAVAFLVFISLTTIYFLISRQNEQYAALLNVKKNLVEELIPKREIETKLGYVVSKTNFIKSLQSKNPEYLKYYHIIESALPASSDSAKINSFVIDDKQNLSTTVMFLDKADLYTFIDTIEKPEFADHFRTLSVDAVSISDAQFIEKGGVSVTLAGSLKNL